jgi:hypothetical protein
MAGLLAVTPLRVALAKSVMPPGVLPEVKSTGLAVEEFNVPSRLVRVHAYRMPGGQIPVQVAAAEKLSEEPVLTDAVPGVTLTDTGVTGVVTVRMTV